jgi:uncharacterized protein DUF6941
MEGRGGVSDDQGVCMQVTLAVLADYVNNTPEGKLNIMGIFNSVSAPAFPTLIHDMRIIVKFQFSAAERGQTRNVQFKFLDTDGNELLALSQPLDVPGNALNPEVAHIVNLRGIVIPTPGEYAFSILMNDEERARIPLHVEQIPGPVVQGS